MTVINHALEPEFAQPAPHLETPPVPPPDSNQTETRNLSWYLDAFLQPANIKWLLIAGVLILLASSLMLVSAYWNEYTHTGKYLILLGYTAGTWLAGRWTYRRLVLRRTGTVVMALTVLLLPVSFLALNVVATGPPWVVMFALNLAVAGFAARDVFRHFLRGDQRTFLVSYLLLCAAGAVVSSTTGLVAAAIVALILWMTFAIGAIKVNRHVFWLVEENRWPRIFGFFPILLLGAQFLALYALGPAGHLPAQWMGLGLALVAAVVLATTDSVARVFQQRTGDLVRPLPWAISGPLVIALVLCAAALCIAASGLVPPGRPYAVVPTAVVVAGLLAMVARRTGKRGFVWAALVVATVAYNFSPVFFTTLARAAISHGAAAVRESRLPYPFYGLTYLPLLAALLALGALARRRGWALLFEPVRAYSLGLSCLLLAASVGHSKALFPVAAAMTAVLAAQAFVFRSRRPVVPAVVAWVIASVGLCPFLRDVIGLPLPFPAAELVAVAGGAALLLLPGHLIDHRIARLSGPCSSGVDPGASWWNQICQLASLALTLALPAAWIIVVAPGDPGTTAWIAAAITSVLLLVHSVVRVDRWLSLFALSIVEFFALRWIAPQVADAGALLSVATLALLAQWVVSRFLESRRPAWRVSRAFAAPAAWISGVALTALLACVYLPALAARAIGVDVILPLPVQPSVFLAAILVGWGCDGARRWSSPLLATAACLAALATIAAGFVDLTGDRTWLPATLAAAGVVGLAGAELFTRRSIANAGRNARVAADGVPHRSGTFIPAASASQRVIPRSFGDEGSRDGECVPCPEIPPVAFGSHQDDGWASGAVPEQGTRPVHPGGAAAATGRDWRVVADAMTGIALAVLTCTAAAALVNYTAALQTAGVIAAAGLVVASRLPRFAPRMRSLALALVTWQAIALLLAVLTPGASADLLRPSHLVPASLPLACLAAAGLLVWQRFGDRLHAGVARGQRVALRVAVAACLVVSMGLAAHAPVDVCLAVAAFIALIGSELWSACRRQDASRAWSAQLLMLAAVTYFVHAGVIQLGRGLSLYAPLAAALAFNALARLAGRRPATAVLAQPFGRSAALLPMATVFLAISRELNTPNAGWLGTGSLAMFLAAGFYFWRGVERRQAAWHVLAAGIVNVALALLWRELHLADPQFYMVPLGASVLILVQALKREIPAAMHDPLRYAGALLVLVSPTFHIVSGGSWAHLLSLMVLSVAVMLAAMGLRVRAMLYAGGAFLAADLVAMVAYGSLDRPSVLWLAGLAVGAAVLVLGALAERNREELLQRVRVLSARLEAWD